MTSKVIALHLTYRSRADERGKSPTFPSYFLKPPSSLASTNTPLARPDGCELLAFEGEIALVIGTRARDIDPTDGWRHVGWVTAANDLGLHDLKYADAGSNLRSKGGDGFCPIGPTFLDATGVDPDRLRVRTWVNGALRQEAVTGDELLFDFATMIADLTRFMTLEVGDVILTGTPTGSTVVTPGDVVEVEVDDGERSTGLLRTPIVDGDRLADWGAPPRVTPAGRTAAHGTPPIDDPVAARYGTEVADRLRSVSTATLASQLRKNGLGSCLLDGLEPLRPDLKMVGFAKTVRYLPFREDLFGDKAKGLNAQKRAVESIRPGEVLVIEARRDPDAGTIGDILALRTLVRGAAGIVTDGAVRDHAAVAALDIATFAAGRHPAVLGRKHVPWETDVAVACAGVLIQPGDLLVGDSDGVVVLPHHAVADLAAAATTQEREERFVAEEVANGASIAGLYPMDDQWRSRYERWDESTADDEVAE